jgi:hypothetical protein
VKLFVATQASVFRFDQRPAKVGKKLNDRLCQAIEGYRKLFEQVVFQHVERHTTMNDDVKRSFFVVVLRHQFRVGANQVRVKRRCCIALDGTTFAGLTWAVILDAFPLHCSTLPFESQRRRVHWNVTGAPSSSYLTAMSSGNICSNLSIFNSRGDFAGVVDNFAVVDTVGVVDVDDGGDRIGGGGGVSATVELRARSWHRPRPSCHHGARDSSIDPAARRPRRSRSY